MSKVGTTYPAEWLDITDPRSGIAVKQLTNHRAHSHHLYFTNPGWYDGGRRLLISSDRGNRTNLFGMDLESGEITQITNLDPLSPTNSVVFLQATVNPTRAEAYFWYGYDAVAIDLHTYKTHTIWTRPETHFGSMMNCSADGLYVCAGITEDLSAHFKIDYLRGYVGFDETWEYGPDSRIVKIPIDGGQTDTIRQENTWIGHVNTSPTQPSVLTFCHEGPWEKVDNRIWGMDIDSGEAWHIRPREVDSENIGHEYWHADGIHVGYHGGRPDGSRLFGRIRFDNSDKLEVQFPHETGHIHSNDFDLIVGDGGNEVRLWKWNGTAFNGPRVLCEHRSSGHIQQTHVHPRFTPDGSHVLFTSDVSGYGNVYLAKVPKFESLPEL
jgi:oligogalacturonide lyase